MKTVNIVCLLLLSITSLNAQEIYKLNLKIQLENLPDNEKFHFTTYKPGGRGDTIGTGVSKSGQVLIENKARYNGGDFFFLRYRNGRFILFLDEFTEKPLLIRGDFKDQNTWQADGSISNLNYTEITKILKKYREQISSVSLPIPLRNKMDSLSKSNYDRKIDSLRKIYHGEWYRQIFKHPNLGFSAALISDGGFLTLKEKKKAFESLTDRVKKSKYGIAASEKIKEQEKSGENITPIEKSKMIGMGKVVPDFSFKTPDGKNYSFKEALAGGKLLFIDFWASWCRPCRAENPNIKKVYDTFHQKGLNILGISLDSDATAWKKAIEKDQLNWNHISDLKGWNSEAAIMFNLGGSIPRSFLIDGKGKIIAMDLRGEALGKKIQEILGNNSL